MNAQEHLARVLRLLQGTIRAAGHTQTEVDERIGRRRGYLSHVFQRRVDLKLHDLLRVLEVLKVEPAAFFSPALAGRGGEHPQLEELMQLVSEATPRGPMPPPSPPPSAAPPLFAPPPQPPSPAEPAVALGEDHRLVERVRAIVHELLTGGEAAPGSPPGGRPPER